MTAVPLIRQPQAFPVIGTDAHLPPVPTDRLTAQALRARFDARAVWQAELPGDGASLSDSRPVMPAAVLVPLVQRDELQVLLTRRTDHLRDHAGQISFPGGRADPTDVDLRATALREAQEEVGLSAQHVDVLGTLPPYLTITSYAVTPVVALVSPQAKWQPDPFEVAEIFEVPLRFLMTPSNHRRHQFDSGGHRREFLSMPWPGTQADGSPREYFIWGATAAMLRNLYAFLSS